MFGWFGNSGANDIEDMSLQGSSWNPAETPPPSKPTMGTDWDNVLDKAGGYVDAITSVVSAVNTANSYDEQYRSLSDKADTTKRNLWALQENYDKEKLMLDIDAYKTLGGIRARIGESGSGLDLLQESAMNYGIESWELGNAFSYQLNQMFRQYKSQRKASNIAKSGRVGAWIGTAGAIALAPFTGGASLAFADKAAQAGGSIGSALH